MHAQGCFVDVGIGPCAGDQFILVDRFSGVLDKSDENIEGSAAETQRLAAVE